MQTPEKPPSLSKNPHFPCSISKLPQPSYFTSDKTEAQIGTLTQSATASQGTTGDLISALISGMWESSCPLGIFLPITPHLVILVVPSLVTLRGTSVATSPALSGVV